MNINTINDMIGTLLRARDLLGGSAPFAVVNDHGSLVLTKNDNVIISNGALVVNTSDWSNPIKDRGF